MAISKKEVLHIAHLSRLELSENEVEKFTKQFGDILEYIAVLREVDTDAVQPTSQVTGLTNVTRPDVAGEVLDKQSIFINAPDTKDGYFKVKKVIE